MPGTWEEQESSMPGEMERRGEKDGSAAMIDGEVRQGWCLLLIKVRSDIKQALTSAGISIIRLYVIKSVSLCASEVCFQWVPQKQVQYQPWDITVPLKNTQSCQTYPESPSTVKGVTTHPVCRRLTTVLQSLKPTAALVGKQLNCGWSFSHSFHAHIGTIACRVGGTPARLSSLC